VAEAHIRWTRSRLTFNPIGHGRASDARTRDQGLTPKKPTVRFVEGPPRMGKAQEMFLAYESRGEALLSPRVSGSRPGMTLNVPVVSQHV
jgi:hypothetical protein